MNTELAVDLHTQDRLRVKKKLQRRIANKIQYEERIQYNLFANATTIITRVLRVLLQPKEYDIALEYVPQDASYSNVTHIIAFIRSDLHAYVTQHALSESYSVRSAMRDMLDLCDTHRLIVTDLHRSS